MPVATAQQTRRAKLDTNSFFFPSMTQIPNSSDQDLPLVNKTLICQRANAKAFSPMI